VCVYVYVCLSVYVSSLNLSSLVFVPAVHFMCVFAACGVTPCVISLCASLCVCVCWLCVVHVCVCVCVCCMLSYLNVLS
jgi:hypothetical protein